MSYPLKLSPEFLSSFLDGTANLFRLKGNKTDRLVKFTSIRIEMSAHRAIIVLSDDDKEIGRYDLPVPCQPGTTLYIDGLEMYGLIKLTHS